MEEVECEARIGLRLRDDAAGERLNAIHSAWVNSGWILQESDTERRITIEKMTYLLFEGRFLLRCDCGAIVTAPGTGREDMSVRERMV